MFSAAVYSDYHQNCCIVLDMFERLSDISYPNRFVRGRFVLWESLTLAITLTLTRNSNTNT